MDRADKDTYSRIVSCLFEKMDNCIETELRYCNINSDLLLQLLELDVRGRNYLQKNAHHFISLEIDSKVMATILKKWWSTREDYDLEDQFLLLQAPQKLMRELFGMHATTFSWRRKLLGLHGKGKHRPFYCDAESEIKIWNLWHKYAELGERERYLKVSELTNYNISIISAAVNRYNETSAKRV